MTTKPMTITKTKEKRAQFPDFPPREDMQNWQYLYYQSAPAALASYLGNSDTTVVGCEIPVALNLSIRQRVRIPDLLASRDCDPELLREQKGYAIDRQGKPPDFVLEVASFSTGVTDYTQKRMDYARFGIPEYWRFDPSGGEYHDVALAGDRLIDGEYEPIEIEWLDDNRRRGYSNALGLYLCWEYGELLWYDPVAEQYLRTYEEEEVRADQEAVRADQEAARADFAEVRVQQEAQRADEESQRADRAEAELRRLRQQLAESEPDL